MKEKKHIALLFILIIIVSYMIFMTAQYNQTVNQLESKSQIITSFNGTVIDDTSQVETYIDQLIKESDIHKNTLRYGQAFDCLYDALLYSEYIQNPKLCNLIYYELGVLMKIFDQNDKALSYFEQAIRCKEEMCEADAKADTRKELFSMAVTQIQQGEYNQAIITLDQNDQLLSHFAPNDENYFTLLQRGVVLMHTGHIDRAEEIMLECLAHFEHVGAHYLVIVYRYIGELYQIKKLYKHAISYYEKALDAITLFKSHTDIQYAIYHQLSRIYFAKGNFELAYMMLKKSKEVEDRLFNVKQASNLFMIRDKYRENLTHRDLKMKEQESQIHQNHVKQLRHQLFSSILFALACIIAIITFFYFRHLSDIKKAKRERIRLETNHEHLLSELEHKNKELAGYVLQIIHKEKIITDLVTNHDAASMMANTQFETLWTEFNHRFVQINQTFYDHLLESYPSLTPTELKHCALIKLNFSSKEMSQLLRISHESVHTSRYRIRKKLQLSRHTSLENFIAQVY